MSDDDSRVWGEVAHQDCYGLRYIADPVRTIVDIGAHTGLFCILAAALFPAAQIIAIECDGANAKHLRARVNGLPVMVHHAALVGSRRVTGLHVIGGRSIGIGLVYDDVPLHAKATLSLAALPTTIHAKDAISGSIDFLKIDAEGAEYDAVMDGDWRGVRRFAMEVHQWALPTAGWRTMCDRLTAGGFAIGAHDESAEQFIVRGTRIS